MRPIFEEIQFFFFLWQNSNFFYLIFFHLIFLHLKFFPRKVSLRISRMCAGSTQNFFLRRSRTVSGSFHGWIPTFVKIEQYSPYFGTKIGKKYMYFLKKTLIFFFTLFFFPKKCPPKFSETVRDRRRKKFWIDLTHFQEILTAGSEKKTRILKNVNKMKKIEINYKKS